MRFVIVDLETTGIDKDKDQILQVGMVAADTSKPPCTWKAFDTYVQHDRYSGSSYALTLNHNILKELNKYENGNFDDSLDNSHMVVHIDNLTSAIYGFLVDSGYTSNFDGKISVVFSGKNAAGFDIPFLNNVPGFLQSGITIHRRVLDPVTLYTDLINDKIPPSLDECKNRAGIKGFVTHNAVEDCWDVALLLLNKAGWKIDKHIDNCTEFGNWHLRTVGIDIKDKYILSLNDLNDGNPFTRYTLRNKETNEEYYVWSKEELDNLV